MDFFDGKVSLDLLGKHKQICFIISLFHYFIISIFRGAIIQGAIVRGNIPWGQFSGHRLVD